MEHQERFADYLRYERRYSAHTVEAYRRDLVAFAEYLKRDGFGLEAASHHQVRAWLMDLAEEKMGARTLNRKVATLRTFYKYLRRHGGLAADPMASIRNRKVPGRVPITARAEDVLRKPVEMEPGTERNLLVELRNRLVVDLLYGTGMRRAELLALRPQDVDTGRGVVTVTGKRNKMRQIPLPSPLADALRRYMSERAGTYAHLGAGDALILTDKGAPAYPGLINKIVGQALAGAANLEKRSPHVLRHSFATHMLDAGSDLQSIKELLGHASLAATQVYTHNSVEKLKAAFAKAHPKGGNGELKIEG